MIDQIVQTEMMYSDIGVKEIIFDYNASFQNLHPFIVKKTKKTMSKKKVRSADFKLNEPSNNIKSNDEFFFSFFENNKNHFKRNAFLISPRLIREPVLNTPKIYYENEHDFNDRNQKHNFGSSKFNKEIENDLKSNLNDIMKENPTQNAVYFRNFKSEG